VRKRLAAFYAAIVLGCGAPGNIQMVPNQFAGVGWQVIPLVSIRTCLY
jgi:hypothetical protein